MKTRKQKRYHEEADILREIVRIKRLQMAAITNAEQQEKMRIDWAQKADDSDDPHHRAGFENQAIECKIERNRFYRLAKSKDVSLERLKHTLAAFNTEILQGIIEDRAVV